MDKKKVGNRIQKYREKADMSQEILAEKMSLSVTSISNIERGRNFPSLENFIKMCNIIGVSSDLILTDVVDQADKAKTTELSDKLSALSPAERRQVIAVIESMIKNFSE